MKILFMFVLFVPPLYVTGTCNHEGKTYQRGDEFIQSCKLRCRCEEVDNARSEILCTPYCGLKLVGCKLGQKPVEVQGPVDENGCSCPVMKCSGTPIVITTTKKPTTTPKTEILHGCRYGGNIYFDGDEFIKGCKERCTCNMIRYDKYEATCSPYCFTFPIPCLDGKKMVYEDGPPDDNNCRCKMAKCKALPSAPLGCKSNKRTSGGNAKGACCVFPFKYKGTVYNDCTSVESDFAWCYTGNGRAWGYCPALPSAPLGCKSNKKTTGGDAKGACCAFPFKYKGTVYNDCTSVDSDHAWCYTEKNRKWGYCPGETSCKSGMRTSGGNAGGACCIFPFKYKGKTYDKSCTTLDHVRPWCYTEKVGKWGECPEQKGSKSNA